MLIKKILTCVSIGVIITSTFKLLLLNNVEASIARQVDAPVAQILPQGTIDREFIAYCEFCHLAANNESVFAGFKRNPIYQAILEHVSYDQGLQYLDVIKKKYPHIFEQLNQLKENDTLGNPIVYHYEGVGDFSPTTLRYIKTAADLYEKFGDLRQKHIVEIGAGYGGQCKILSDLGGFASYTSIDLPGVNALTKKYLTLHGIENVVFIDHDHIDEVKNYDLVISNYAFSEVNVSEQSNYVDRIIGNTPCGYMIMNSIAQKKSEKAYSVEDLVAILFNKGRQGKVEKEQPLTHRDNLLLTWKPLQSIEEVVHRSSPIADTYSLDTQQGKGITYELNGGRLGDSLMAYFHAKWLSYKYSLPLLFVPFQNADQFCLSDLDPPLSTSNAFQNVTRFRNEKDIHSSPPSSLIVVPYFPDHIYEFESLNLSNLPYFKVDWEDPGFQEEVRKCLTPKNHVTTLDLPSDRITVGVHIRRGGIKTDANEMIAKRILPLKFPPDSYYIEQIRRIAKIFKNEQIYVYILTDDLDPQAITEKYKNAINNPNLEFACYDKTYFPESNIIGDFFSIPKFDCMILCQSNFSHIASKLGQYKIAIAPIRCHHVKRKVIIDEVELIFIPAFTKSLISHKLSDSGDR